MNRNVIDHAYSLLSKRRQDWGLEQPFLVSPVQRSADQMLVELAPLAQTHLTNLETTA
jgi:hypothetical protein